MSELVYNYYTYNVRTVECLCCPESMSLLAEFLNLKKKSKQMGALITEGTKVCSVHFAYGRIALTLELLGQFLDENDRCNPPNLLILFSRLLGL